jgi:hypothetical protein
MIRCWGAQRANRRADTIRQSRLGRGRGAQSPQGRVVLCRLQRRARMLRLDACQLELQAFLCGIGMAPCGAGSQAGAGATFSRRFAALRCARCAPFRRPLLAAPCTTHIFGRFAVRLSLKRCVTCPLRLQITLAAGHDILRPK